MRQKKSKKYSAKTYEVFARESRIKALKRIREFYLYEDGWTPFFSGAKRVTPAIRELLCLSKQATMYSADPREEDCFKRCLSGAFSWQRILPGTYRPTTYFNDREVFLTPLMVWNDSSNVEEVLMLLEFLIYSEGGTP